MIQNLTVDDKNFLTGIAKKIIELKLVTPAIFFLDLSKQMVIIGLQNYLKVALA